MTHLQTFEGKSRTVKVDFCKKYTKFLHFRVFSALFGIFYRYLSKFLRLIPIFGKLKITNISLFYKVMKAVAVFLLFLGTILILQGYYSQKKEEKE